jgi:hypothetical protein
VVTPGQTIKRLVPPEEGGVFPPGEKLEMPSFGPGDKNDFQLRTVGYKKHGIKAASSEPLYELVALDMFKTNRRVDRIYGNLDLASLNLPDTVGHDEWWSVGGGSGVVDSDYFVLLRDYFVLLLMIFRYPDVPINQATEPNQLTNPTNPTQLTN